MRASAAEVEARRAADRGRRSVTMEKCCAGSRCSINRQDHSDMPYPESFIGPMRQELTRLGVQELKTADQVDTVLRQTPGTVMVVVNSMCGCAAGKARPGIARALTHAVKPDLVTTVFAGGDIEATERVRSYFTGYPPSSPS